MIKALITVAAVIVILQSAREAAAFDSSQDPSQERCSLWLWTLAALFLIAASVLAFGES